MFFNASRPALRHGSTSLSWPVQRFLVSRRCGAPKRLHLDQLSLTRLPENPSVAQHARFLLDISAFSLGVGMGLASLLSVLGERPVKFVSEDPSGTAFVRSEHSNVLTVLKSEGQFGEEHKAVGGGFAFVCHCRRAGGSITPPLLHLSPVIFHATECQCTIIMSFCYPVIFMLPRYLLDM